MRRHAAVTLGLLVAAASANAQVSITGVKSQVTTNPGAQYDPSISGDVVVYTDRRSGNDDIYFTDLASGSEMAVATDPNDQRLHDVSDARIVFTDYAGAEPQVWVYDVTGATSAPIAPTPTDRQMEPALDGSLVAFEVFSPPYGNADMAIADLATGSYARITSTPEHEGRPAVGGTFVVFERGPAPLAVTSDVVLYDTAVGTEVVLGTGLDVHTDGRRVTWRTGSHTDADVVVFDAADGSYTTISYAGAQTRPRLSGDVLAFDDNSLGDPDVVLVHLPSGVTHRVASAAGTAEFLNDVDGNRLVYTSTETGNFDIFLFEFTLHGLPPPPPPPPASLTEDPCQDTSGLTELFSQDFTRERGKPGVVSASFAHALNGLEAGVVVVENQRCASTIITLNGEEVLSPSDFDAEMQCAYEWVPLVAENLLDVEVRSRPTCTVTVKVYAVDPPAIETDLAVAGELSCDASSARGGAPIAAFALLLLALGRRRRS